MHGDGLFRIYDLITLRRSEIEERLSKFKLRKLKTWVRREMPSFSHESFLPLAMI